MLPTTAKADGTSANHLILWLFYIWMKCIRYFTTLSLSLFSCKLENIVKWRNQDI